LFLLLVTAIAAVCIGIVHFLMRSPYGRAITAMRNDEVSFESLGRNPVRIKMVIVALGSGMSGLAGALYAHFYLYLTPEQFGIFYTAVILTMVVVGGVATTWGPVFGAVVLTVLPELVRFLDLPIAVMAPLQGVIYTLLIMFFIFWRPQGLLGGGRTGGGLESWSARKS
jgi:branched-chain amino acid transport system permease protein